jgi:hypothetical protein
MNEPNPPGKVTVFELLAMIQFISPTMIGLIEGKKLGFWAAVIGVVVGLILGVATAVGYRLSLELFLRWMRPHAESPPSERKAWLEIAGILLFVAAIAWGVACAIFAGFACRWAVHRIFA